MSLNRRNPKRDAIEAAVVEVFQAHGWIVERLSSKGAPDLVCWNERAPRPILFVECKSKTGRPTEAQRKWKGPPPLTVTSVEDALALLRGSR